MFFESGVVMKQYIVTGMSCAACQARVEKAVSKVKGVESVSVSLLTNSMGVEGTASDEDIIAAVINAGYGAEIKGGTDKSDDCSCGFKAEEEALRDNETPVLKRRLILSAVFLAVLMYITMGVNMLGAPIPSYFVHNHLALTLTQMILAAVVMIINRKFFTSGFKALFHASPNMDTLVALGSAVSFVWSVLVFYRMCGLIADGSTNTELMHIYHNELYFESAAMIPALITVGKLLEAVSKGRTTNALKSLMKLAPKTALVVRDGKNIEVNADEVTVGDIFLVYPGDRIPVDGVVIEGASAVDESALTGESVPVDKAKGDIVSAAAINKSGYMKCRAVRVGRDTSLAQIIRMVSDAAATKAPIARIADKVSEVFVPAVIAVSLTVIFGWLISGSTLSFALARGISVLVISCPCALGLATPVAIMVGNGVGAKNGILFKTSEALENTGRVRIIALDKTGTITTGEPRVTDIFLYGNISENAFLETAASLEQKSEHPLAGAVISEAKRRNISFKEATEFSALAGNGLKAVIDGHNICGGSEKYISSLVKIPDEFSEKSKILSEQGKTPLFFISDNKLIGMAAVADTIRHDSAEAVGELKKSGLRVVMLTGDNERTAKAVGDIAGVDEVIAGVLPDKKEEVIRTLRESGMTAMVGDGINDAPALTRADVGIAIGAGTDVAIESADVVLTNSTLMDAVSAVRLSRAVLRNIRENLFWAFIYNIICIPLAAGLFGLNMSPMISAAAMSLSSFTVCMNALRLNRFKVKCSVYNAQCPVNDNEKGGESMTKTVNIKGMMCGHCEATVKKALEKLDFIESAEVSHESGTAVITLSGELDEQAVKEAIEDRDFEFCSITP